MDALYASLTILGICGVIWLVSASLWAVFVSFWSPRLMPMSKLTSSAAQREQDINVAWTLAKMEDRARSMAVNKRLLGGKQFKPAIEHTATVTTLDSSFAVSRMASAVEGKKETTNGLPRTHQKTPARSRNNRD